MEKPQITQAMINAYDEYTHLTLDRRSFMQKLTVLTGSAASAAAIAPLLAANSAQAEMIPEADPRVKAEDVSYPGAGGDMKGYLVRPADASGKLPAVIVIHENRGLNPHIKASPAAWRWKVSSRSPPISCRLPVERRPTRTRPAK